MATRKTKRKTKKGQRAVIVGGLRTPFVKAFTSFMKMDSIDLGVVATKSLLDRCELPAREIDSIIWGGVVLPSLAPTQPKFQFSYHVFQLGGGSFCP